MPGTTTVNPSNDTTGATDTAAINAAFSASDKNTIVILGPGDFYTNAPLTPGTGNALYGQGAGVNGVTSTNPSGSVIHPSTSFSGSDVITLANGNQGNRLRNFAIDYNLATASGVNGIALRGDVEGTLIEYVSIVSVTGHGIACLQQGGADGDGLWMRSVMIQRPGLNGVHRPVNDANIHNVHIQYAGEAGDSVNKHGFYTTSGSGGNMCYVACRADLCVGSGWLIDHQGVYGDATKLTGCSTERNGQSGVLITNTSAAGTDWRSPVILSGCCFEGDGAATGDYAGIEVVGKNRVFIDGTITAVNTVDVASGCPKYGIIFRQAGTAPGQPETVEWASGRVNFSTAQGGALYLNQSFCDNLLFGPTLTYAGDYEDQTPTTRTGKATLNASGQATVSTAWAYARMLVCVTPLASPAGRLYISNRTTGSFTIKSTSTTDNGLVVAWWIPPGA